MRVHTLSSLRIPSAGTPNPAELMEMQQQSIRCGIRSGYGECLSLAGEFQTRQKAFDFHLVNKHAQQELSPTTGSIQRRMRPVPSGEGAPSDRGQSNPLSQTIGPWSAAPGPPPASLSLRPKPTVERDTSAMSLWIQKTKSAALAPEGGASLRTPPTRWGRRQVRARSETDS